MVRVRISAGFTGLFLRTADPLIDLFLLQGPTGRSTNDRARAALVGPAIVAERFRTAGLVRIAARLFFAIVIAWVVYRALVGDASDTRTIEPASFVREIDCPEPIQNRTGRHFTEAQPFEMPLNLQHGLGPAIGADADDN